jgi:pre-mRNA-splicing factor ATP-dependent RNA helicase DHX38/PRP16
LDDLPFLDKLAILLSRSLNTLNPNKVLAKTVYNLSKQHSLDSFTKAISAFGRFSSHQADELYTLCQQQDTIDEAFQQPGHHPGGSTSNGAMRILDHDVLEPDQPTHNPGLSVNADHDLNGDNTKHVFKQPQHTIRTSTLGLDKLAAEKRRERETASGTSSSTSSASSSMLPPPKRIKYDEYDDASQLDDHSQEFKSEFQGHSV